MIRDDVHIGVMVTVIGPRWDQPPRTLARVTETGHHAIGGQWSFTVEWLTGIHTRSQHSLRMGEEDLNTFQVVTGDATPPAAREESRLAPPPRPLQIPLPFAADDDDD